MAETLGNWYNGSPVITLDNVAGDFSGWSNGAPVVKKPKKHARFDVTGLAGTGAIGDVTVHINATAAVSGLEATGAIGTVTVIINASTQATGIEASGAIGTVTVTTTGGPPERRHGIGWPFRRRTRRHVEIGVDGIFSKGAVGDVTVTTGSKVTVTAAGSQASALVGSVRVRSSGYTFAFSRPGLASVGNPAVRAARSHGASIRVSGLQTWSSVGRPRIDPVQNLSDEELASFLALVE